MGCSGHFGPGIPDLRMPRSEDGVDEELGIRYEGDALRGRLGVREAILRADLQARNVGVVECSRPGMAAGSPGGEIRGVKPLNPVRDTQGGERAPAANPTRDRRVESVAKGVLGRLGARRRGATGQVSEGACLSAPAKRSVQPPDTLRHDESIHERCGSQRG